MEKITDKYFWYDSTIKEYKEVEGKPAKLPGYENFDLFIHLTSPNYGKRYAITEGKTGLMVFQGEFRENQKTVKSKTLDRIKIYEERGRFLNKVIESEIQRVGLSPRYKERIN